MKKTIGSVICILALVTCALVLTSCGSKKESPRLTKAEYIAQADKICTDINKVGDAFVEPKTKADWPKFSKEATALWKKQLSQLKTLNPPTSMEADVNAWLTTEGNLTKLFEEIGPAGEKSGLTAVSTVAMKHTADIQKETTLVKKLGLKVCGFSSTN